MDPRMSIETDIIAAMDAAPAKPIGLHLGHSAWHALAARSKSIEALGDDLDSAADLAAIAALARFRSLAFLGVDLILDDQPNPRRKRRAAA